MNSPLNRGLGAAGQVDAVQEPVIQGLVSRLAQAVTGIEQAEERLRASHGKLVHVPPVPVAGAEGRPGVGQSLEQRLTALFERTGRAADGLHQLAGEFDKAI